MKKMAITMMCIGAGVGALLWYKKKNPDMICDMKKGIKKAADCVSDAMSEK